MHQEIRFLEVLYIPGHTDPLFRRMLTPHSSILTPPKGNTIPGY